jgi:hypothetical protein
MSEMVDVFDLYPLFFFFLQTDTDIKFEIVLILKHICCLLILLFCSDALFRCTSANLLFSLVTFRGQVIIVRLSMLFCPLVTCIQLLNYRNSNRAHFQFCVHHNVEVACPRVCAMVGFSFFYILSYSCQFDVLFVLIIPFAL